MECIQNPTYMKRLTFLAYCFQMFQSSFEFSAQMTQVVYYLVEIKAPDVSLWQGVLTMTSPSVGAIFSLLFGYVSDRYGKARIWISIANLISIAGCIVCAIPWSPFVLFLGVALRGAAYGVESVTIGEVTRIVRKEKVTRTLSAIRIGSALGLIVGPLLNLCLKNVNYQHNWFFIHPTNAPSYVIAFAIFLCQIFLMLFMYNSEDINEAEKSFWRQKKLDSDNERIPLLQKENNKQPQRIERDFKIFPCIRLLLSNVDIVLLYVCTYVWGVAVFAFYGILPLCSIEWLGLDSIHLTYVYVASGGMFALVYITTAFLKDINDMQAIIPTSSLQVLIPTLIVIIWSYKDKSFVYIFYWMFVLLGSSVGILESVLVRSLTSKLAPAEIQGFAEGCRTVPATLGSLSSAIVIPVLYKYTLIASIAMIAAELIIIFALLYRWKNLKHPIKMIMPLSINIK